MHWRIDFLGFLLEADESRERERVRAAFMFIMEMKRAVVAAAAEETEEEQYYWIGTSFWFFKRDTLHFTTACTISPQPAVLTPVDFPRTYSVLNSKSTAAPFFNNVRFTFMNWMLVSFYPSFHHPRIKPSLSLSISIIIYIEYINPS